jgi:hypothetical protein
VEVHVKQGIRFIVRPKTFFNQLQWSTHHWVILFSFLALAAVETQVGRQHQLYQSVALFMQYRFGMGLDIALWVVMAGRLAAMVFGAFVMTTLIHLVGSLIGNSGSRRVLSRRLAVVFTVFLAGFTLQHLSMKMPNLFYASMAFYAWGMVLGYIAIREQFHVNPLETAIIAIFAALLVTTTWQFSNHMFEVAVRQQLQSLAKKTSDRPVLGDQFKSGSTF